MPGASEGIQFCLQGAKTGNRIRGQLLIRSVTNTLTNLLVRILRQDRCSQRGDLCGQLPAHAGRQAPPVDRLSGSQTDDV